MYKAKPHSPAPKAAASPSTASKRSIRTPLPSIHKENLLLDTNNIFGNTQIAAKQGCRVASGNQKYIQIPELIELKLTQPLKATHQSKRKLLRPWAAKPIDPNRETLRADLLRISLDKTKDLFHERRESARESLGRSRELESYNSQLRASDECTQTVRFAKATSTRQRSETGSRDKTGSCKIALKKSLFPIRPRQCEQQRIALHFEREEDLLSTIQKEEDGDRFISIDSYTKLVF